MLFDTHAHYDDDKFDSDRHDAIARAFENGVSYILNASSDMDSVRTSISLAGEFDSVYAAVGIHPHNVAETSESAVRALSELAGNRKVVAIGEIGLDYYYDFAPRELQKQWFIKQIDLARNLGLPIIVHNREAHEDVLRIVKNECAGEMKGVFHCFSGSVEMAKELVLNGFYISVGGQVTFKNAKRIIDVVKQVPDNRLLIETDCPYLAPEPYRGKRNESSYLKFTAEKVAEIRGADFEHIAEITTKNAKMLFGIADFIETSTR